jgi:uncharacterized OB-fold protein
MPSELLKPGLYSTAGTQALPDRPALLGGQCSCGYVFFPMQRYGCEQCGRHGDALKAQALSGRGVLLATAVVHIHGDKQRPSPFTIGKIALDDGPVVRTLIADSPSEIAPGQPMVAVLLPVGKTEGGQQIVDLRFTALR